MEIFKETMAAIKVVADNIDQLESTEEQMKMMERFCMDGLEETTKYYSSLYAPLFENYAKSHKLTLELMKAISQGNFQDEEVPKEQFIEYTKLCMKVAQFVSKNQDAFKAAFKATRSA